MAIQFTISFPPVGQGMSFNAITARDFPPKVFKEEIMSRTRKRWSLDLVSRRNTKIKSRAEMKRFELQTFSTFGETFFLLKFEEKGKISADRHKQLSNTQGKVSSFLISFCLLICILYSSTFRVLCAFARELYSGRMGARPFSKSRKGRRARGHHWYGDALTMSSVIGFPSHLLL